MGLIEVRGRGVSHAASCNSFQSGLDLANPGRARSTATSGDRDVHDTNTPQILRSMFSRLLNLEIEPALARSLAPWSTASASASAAASTWKRSKPEHVRALLCSMVVHGWAMACTRSQPVQDLESHPIEVRVSKDILMQMADLQSLRT